MPNEEMRELWTTTNGPQWVVHRDVFERMMEPITADLFAALAIDAGSRAVDVGCGTGATSRMLRDLGAQVVGVDISATLIDEARALAPDINFEVLDAQSDPLGGPFDAVVSRFGVMFFDDPVAAFANIAASTVDGGTLTFVCWRGPDENEIFTVGTRALLAALPPPASPPDPHAPGPAAFADPARVRGILIDAGWSAIEISPLDGTCRFSVGGSDGIEERMVHMLGSETGRRFLDEVAAAHQPAALTAARRQLRERLVDGELELHGAAWLVRARH